MRGVCGGGRINENSEASEVRGVCVEERVKSTLTLCERRVTRD